MDAVPDAAMFVYWTDGRNLFEQIGRDDNDQVVWLQNSRRPDSQMLVPYDELRLPPWRLILPDPTQLERAIQPAHPA